MRRVTKTPGPPLDIGKHKRRNTMRRNLTHFVAAIMRGKLCIFAAAIALLPAIGRSQEYTVTDLGTLGGTYSAATSVNNKGEVAGQSSNASQNFQVLGQADPFLYSNGKMIDLGNFGGSSGYYGGITGNIANAVNDNGVVAGAAFSVDGNSHAFLWNAGTLLNIVPGHPAAAVGMNANGVAVGFFVDGNYENNGVIFNGGGNFELLPVGEVFTVVYPSAINNSGQIAGSCGGNGNDEITGCLISGTTVQALQPSNGYGNSLAYAINASGNTCGESQEWSGNGVSPSLPGTATAWLGGSPVNLGWPPNAEYSQCLGMDDFGQYVGNANSYASNQIGFFWDPVHGARDLNKLIPKFSVKGHEIKIQNAVALSHTGFIAADCLLEEGQSHACLLTPNTVLILHDSILGLAANANNVCVPCEEELAPEARSLPKSLDGLTARERERVVSTVDRIGEQIKGLERRGDISAPIATLLIHQAELVLSAIDPKR
jgi:probable HAF family extracellular repeat protein